MEIVNQEKLKQCPFCGEPILAVAVKCRYCKEFINRPLTAPRQTNLNDALDREVQQIHDWVRISAILWVIIAIFQIVSVAFILVGLWNLFAAYTKFQSLDTIKARDKSVPGIFEPVAGLVIVGAINLFFGGVIGVGLTIFDFVIRDKVLRNRGAFDQPIPTTEPVPGGGKQWN